MDAKYLAEIKAREQGAAQGPWKVGISALITDAYGHALFFGEDAKGNADFIAHARTDIPALISEVERLNVIAEQRYQLYDGALTTIATLEKALELASKFIVEYGRVDQFLCDDIPDPIHLKHQPKNNGDYANRPCIKCVQEYFTLLGAVE
jgi:hypothetical protein